MARRMDPDETRRVKNAAKIIRDEAARIASAFSRRIGPATKVQGGVSGVYIQTNGRLAPNAAPFEFGERHPLFGLTGRPGGRGPKGSGHWYRQPKRPYMEEGARRKLDEASVEYARVIDDWAAKRGYK